jgi:hypothetical protein
MNPTYNKYDAKTNTMDVLLEGRVVGYIKQTPWGFRYVPVGLGQDGGGKVYPTLAKCKASLEV